MHSKNEEFVKGQPTFISDNFQLSSKSRRSLCHQKLVLQAEIVDALDSVEKNERFAGSNGDRKKYKRMFPDSKIGKKYNQQETEMKYTDQFG